MRSACLGLAYHQPEHEDILIALGVESGRITHHNPIGYLGSLASAFMTALAIRRIDPKLWLAHLMSTAIPKAAKYIES